MEYTITVDAPHAELGAQQRETVTRSASAAANFIIGVANDHPDTPLTFVVTATKIHIDN